MSDVVIKVEDLSKQYRLGEVGTGTMKDDFKRFRYKLMGKEDPFITIGEENDRTKTSKSDYVWALQNINFEVKIADFGFSKFLDNKNEKSATMCGTPLYMSP